MRKKQTTQDITFYLFSGESGSVGPLDDDVTVVYVHTLLQLDSLAPFLRRFLLAHSSTYSLLPVNNFLQLFLIKIFLRQFLKIAIALEFAYHTLSCVKVNEAEIHFMA